jgi:hypothetical protein
MDNTKLIYSDDFEELLKEEAEKAESMSILHSDSYGFFNKISILINIPVIMLSAIIGFLGPLVLFDKQTLFLGALSIMVSILKTIDNYFDCTKRAETHRMVSLNYIKISKWIQLQLSLERNFRVNAKDLFDIINNDLQNIRDYEPLIPNVIIERFKIKYKNENTFKPAITNGLTNVKVNNKIYNDDNKIELIIEEKPKDLDINKENKKEIKKPVFKI